MRNFPRRAEAIIGRNDAGTFGIVWRSFPTMEDAGGYSGPFDTLEQAKQRAEEIADFWTARDPIITEVPTLPQS